MPFKSEAQRKYLYAKKPKVAEEFAKKTPKGTSLPKKVRKKVRSEAAKGLIESARNRAQEAQEAQEPEPQKKKRKGGEAAPKKKWSRKKRDKYTWDPDIPFAYIPGGGG